MKIKPLFYLLAIVSGALIMGFGGSFMRQEYAMCLGIVLIMFGIYKTSTSWRVGDHGSEKEE